MQVYRIFFWPSFFSPGHLGHKSGTTATIVFSSSASFLSLSSSVAWWGMIANDCGANHTGTQPTIGQQVWFHGAFQPGSAYTGWWFDSHFITFLGWLAHIFHRGRNHQPVYVPSCPLVHIVWMSGYSAWFLADHGSTEATSLGNQLRLPSPPFTDSSPPDYQSHVNIWDLWFFVAADFL